jgi:hypothetical protein
VKAAIGCLRVSTSEQGRSGVRLVAQRFDIPAFAERDVIHDQVLVSGHNARAPKQARINARRPALEETRSANSESSSHAQE